MKVTQQMPALRACLEDLQNRRLDELIIGISAVRLAEKPIIRMGRRPEGFTGVLVKRTGAPQVRVMEALHKGCQLRWEESA